MSHDSKFSLKSNDSLIRGDISKLDFSLGERNEALVGGVFGAQLCRRRVLQQRTNGEFPTDLISPASVTGCLAGLEQSLP